MLGGKLTLEDQVGFGRLGLAEVKVDPNSTAEHTDVIKRTLQARAADPNANQDQRRQAREMLAMLYPETKPSDPNGRQQPCGDPECQVCRNGLVRTMWNHK